jgi:hypothetical protein
MYVDGQQAQYVLHPPGQHDVISKVEPSRLEALQGQLAQG